ncbi:LuxR C-terminal-related transcriptional regulator [Lutibacter sp. Hel_I_33_5]|uniref:LuxR C-terminal-related transcriptional regulator n=1 Tax=Lutibacter sp. Hel_I_33_5 TaxID=1566289 RepID=UPI0011A9531D|nr:LuxR C-terminal-related transcriptional regulator [Lutibacter sp. Hel_I_33_5]
MRKIIVLFLVLFSCKSFSQAEISYLPDTSNQNTIDNVKNLEFIKVDKTINKGINNGVYWFKIENVAEKTIIQFPNNHLANGVAYYNDKEILSEKNERFLTFIIEQSPTFIKLNIIKEAYIPITIQEYSDYKYSSKKDNLFTGFYYGFAFVVVLINLFYFINFRDRTFLYYALFLFGVSASLFISDGILSFFSLSEKTIDIITLVVHITTSILGALFATSYLQTDNYYPKLQYVILSYIVIQVLLFILYLVTNSFNYFALIEVFSFTLLGIYWVTSLFLFNKNIFTKVFAVAYVFIFLLGVDYYVLKLFGFQLLQISRDYIKMAGFFEMILLSFAVIYRMRILHEENIQMRNDITKYATQISSLSEELEKNKQGKTNYFTEYDLSEREQEIFTLLAQGKSNKEIAETLFISVNTVKYHIKKIYSKLNIKNREEAKQISVI